MKPLKVLTIIVLLFGWVPLISQISDKITIHGFGGWGYGKTDGAHYQFGTKDGDYDHSQFYLNINANPMENLAVIAQIGTTQTEAGIHFEFDYAFAEWSVSDLLRLRIGKVKHAFGIFGEILNVGTVRPFMALPQSIYGATGYVGRGVNGIAVTGSLQSKTGWGLQYDLYWGQLKTVSETPKIVSYLFNRDQNFLNDEMVSYEKDIVSLIGGRLVISTPLEGLSFGLSGYSGEDKAIKGQEGYLGDQKSYGAYLEYISANIWIRSEYMKSITHTMSENVGELEPTADGYYIEAAFKFARKWQAAFRYDWAKGDIAQLDTSLLPRFFQERMKHMDLSFGINYWFNTNFVIKLAYHMVEGIQHAFPHFDDALVFLQGQFEAKTNLIQFGVHFSF